MMSAALKDSSPVARNDVACKIDADVVFKAKFVVLSRRRLKKGYTLAQYLSELLQPLVDRDYKDEMAGQSKQTKPPKKSP
jgi:hypothetical protein